MHPLWETWGDLVHPDCQFILDILENNRDWYVTKIPISPSDSKVECNDNDATDAVATDADKQTSVANVNNVDSQAENNGFQFELTLDEDESAGRQTPTPERTSQTHDSSSSASSVVTVSSVTTCNAAPCSAASCSAPAIAATSCSSNAAGNRTNSLHFHTQPKIQEENDCQLHDA